MLRVVETSACVDLQDRIYGILGLLELGGRNYIADYTETLEKLCSRTVGFFFLDGMSVPSQLAWIERFRIIRKTIELEPLLVGKADRNDEDPACTA